MGIKGGENVRAVIVMIVVSESTLKRKDKKTCTRIDPKTAKATKKKKTAKKTAPKKRTLKASVDLPSSAPPA